jgi:branched-chain amino acid aminotransferase
MTTARARIAYFNGRFVPADEAFLTSTSLCICPVQSVNDVRVGSAIPGPITRQLSDAYCRLVDFDFVGQYLKRLK